MELIRGLHNLRSRHKGCVATIGAFDGLHLGHQAVLRQLTDKASELGLPSVLVVFEPLPREYFSPKEAPARLMSFNEKLRALKALGIDRVLRVRFTESLREMSGLEFVRQVFVEDLAVEHIILGDDSHFGRDRGGDIELLRKMGRSNNFAVESTVTFEIDGERVSSTRIREALEAADFSLAETLLGRPYSIAGRVIVGQQLGRQLNAPTANVELRRLRAPMSGVYAVEIDVAGRNYQGVANVGTRPTVNDSLKAILEVHIFDFDENIYRKNIKVTFRKKIRDEVKFDSVDKLRQQIHQDFQTGRQYFAS
jgi:riboflavin kinase/FMN adenylyltransferase